MLHGERPARRTSRIPRLLRGLELLWGAGHLIRKNCLDYFFGRERKCGPARCLRLGAFWADRTPCPPPLHSILRAAHAMKLSAPGWVTWIDKRPRAALETR